MAARGVMTSSPATRHLKGSLLPPQGRKVVDAPKTTTLESGPHMGAYTMLAMATQHIHMLH